MRRACTAVLASLRLRDTLHGQHAADTVYPIREQVLPPGILAYEQRTSLRQLRNLKSNRDSSALVPATTQHNARHCILHIVQL